MDGTKEQMEKLLARAEELSGVHYDISNLSDIYEAIHVIQENMGVTGTTAKEAQDTLQGSFMSMKASWQNFLSGSGDLKQVAKTFSVFVKNVVRIAKDTIPSIIEGINEALPDLIELAGVIIEELGKGLLSNLPMLMQSAFQVMQSLITGLIDYLPQIIEVGMQVIVELIKRNNTNATNINSTSSKMYYNNS